MSLFKGKSTAVLLLLLPLAAPAAVRYVDLNSTNATPPYTNWSTAATNIQDAVDAADPGDQVLVANGVYATGGRTVNGFAVTNRVAVTKPVTVLSVNGPDVTVIRGYQVPGVTNADGSVRCVYLTNGATLAGFTVTNGSTMGSTNILPTPNYVGGGIFCEATSAVVSNCVIIGNASGLHAGGVFRGFLTGCTIVNNVANQSGVGGGVHNSILSNCVITANSGGLGGGVFSSQCYGCLISSNMAFSVADGGGGANGGTLTNCKLIGNASRYHGGGAYGSTLNNCLVFGNTAGTFGGGVSFGSPTTTANNCTIVSNVATANFAGGTMDGKLNNCLVQFNSSPPPGVDNYEFTTLRYCCTAPMPSGSYDGGGNITNDPAFVNPASGDFRLQSSSSCINSGKNSYATNSPDLDGNPRIFGGTVDIGAYEFQNPASILSYAWAQQYGLPTDGSADSADPDSDGMNNYSEWIAGTIPTNAASLLMLYSSSNNVPGLKVSWQSVSGKSYFLQRATDLAAQPPFLTLQSNIAGLASTTTYTDPTATNAGPYFYRVGVQP